MKIKIRPYEASRLEKDWLATDDWLAELRAMPGGEPPGDGQAELASPRDSWPEAAEEAGVLARDLAAAGTVASAPSVGTAVRAVIGDQLRMPAMWCEMGSCSSRYTDPAASCPAALWNRDDAIAGATRLAEVDIGRPVRARMAPQAAWRTS